MINPKNGGMAKCDREYNMNTNMRSNACFGKDMQTLQKVGIQIFLHPCMGGKYDKWKNIIPETCLGLVCRATGSLQQCSDIEINSLCSPKSSSVRTTAVHAILAFLLIAMVLT